MSSRSLWQVALLLAVPLNSLYSVHESREEPALPVPPVPAAATARISVLLRQHLHRWSRKRSPRSSISWMTQLLRTPPPQCPPLLQGAAPQVTMCLETSAQLLQCSSNRAISTTSDPTIPSLLPLPLPLPRRSRCRPRCRLMTTPLAWEPSRVMIHLISVTLVQLVLPPSSSSSP